MSSLNLQQYGSKGLGGNRMGLPAWLWAYATLPCVLWVMVWFSLNSGPWVLRRAPVTVTQHLHYLRTLFPFLALAVGGMQVAVLMGRQRVLPRVLQPWFWYGLVGTAACLGSPSPLDALFWAASYMVCFVIVMMAYGTGGQGAVLGGEQGSFGGGEMVRLNHVSWIITTLFLAILVFVARDYLFADRDSTYGVYGAVDGVADTAMSRSSGMARFAAVPGVIGLTMLIGCRALILRLLGVGAFLFASWLIYMMQSRGAMFGFAAAVIFVIYLFGPRLRRVAIAGAIALVVLLLLEVIPSEQIQQLEQHIRRGQDDNQFTSMTGRTRDWKLAWAAAQDSFFWGFGFQADRMLIRAHVHNTYLYALLTGGLVGVTLFAAGLIWVWKWLIQLLFDPRVDAMGWRLPLIQTGGILMFFTIRSIPEVCGAHFSVDTMVLLPAVGLISMFGEQLGYGGRSAQVQET